MQHLSQQALRKNEPRREVEYIIPLETNENEPLGNLYKEMLADPIRGTMDYRKGCILGTITREECEKADLLHYLHTKYRRENPEDFKRGIPGPDVVQFNRLPVACQTCILHRYSPKSPENWRETGTKRPSLVRCALWGALFAALIGVWSYSGFGTLTDYWYEAAIMALTAGAIVFMFYYGWIKGRPLASETTATSDHAHGPEGQPSPRSRLRFRRGRSSPPAHEIRYRELADPISSSSVSPTGETSQHHAESDTERGNHATEAAPEQPQARSDAAMTGPSQQTPSPETKVQEPMGAPAIIAPAPHPEPPAPAEHLPVNVKTKPTRGKWECQECHKTFGTKEKLNGHMASHSKKKVTKPAKNTPTRVASVSAAKAKAATVKSKQKK